MVKTFRASMSKEEDKMKAAAVRVNENSNLVFQTSTLATLGTGRSPPQKVQLARRWHRAERTITVRPSFISRSISGMVETLW